MEFLLEPLELGTDFDSLLTTGLTITCEKGYSCDKGTVNPEAN